MVYVIAIVIVVITVHKPHVIHGSSPSAISMPCDQNLT